MLMNEMGFLQITADVGSVNGEANCNVDFEGTSSAAPLAAGCFALVLEAKYVIGDCCTLNSRRALTQSHAESRSWHVVRAVSVRN